MENFSPGTIFFKKTCQKKNKHAFFQLLNKKNWGGDV